MATGSRTRGFMLGCIAVSVLWTAAGRVRPMAHRLKVTGEHKGRQTQRLGGVDEAACLQQPVVQPQKCLQPQAESSAQQEALTSSKF